MSVQTFEQFGSTMFSIASECPSVVQKTIDSVVKTALRVMADSAPVDTGFLKRSIVKERLDADTVRIVARAPYSIFVDKGHHTRSGSFYPANPFFTGVVDQLKRGEIEKVLAENIAAILKRQSPQYREVRISKSTGKKYFVYKKKISSKTKVRRKTSARGL